MTPMLDCSQAPRGGGITTATLRDATSWDEVATELGNEHLKRHGLRHTGLTWMVDTGVPVHAIHGVPAKLRSPNPRSFTHLRPQRHRLRLDADLCGLPRPGPGRTGCAAQRSTRFPVPISFTGGRPESSTTRDCQLQLKSDGSSPRSGMSKRWECVFHTTT
jgi:hypothetical protein